jgi:uncharacterized membrane protein
MSTPNPYAAPKAPVADESVVLASNFTPGGRTVAGGRGWSWLAEGWTMFMKSPGVWIAIIVMLAIIFIVLTFVPFLGGLVISLLLPVFGGGMMLGSRALEEGKDLEFAHLFAGFRTNFGTLAAIGAVYVVASIIIMVIAIIPSGASLFGLFAGGPQDPAAMARAMRGMALSGLIALALFVPLLMAMWFAPALVMLNGLGATQAMKQSFAGCLKNVVPFLLYGVVLTIASIVASLPIFLGWLVLGPVLIASIYASYRDIYLS